MHQIGTSMPHPFMTCSWDCLFLLVYTFQQEVLLRDRIVEAWWLDGWEWRLSHCLQLKLLGACSYGDGISNSTKLRWTCKWHCTTDTTQCGFFKCQGHASSWTLFGPPGKPAKTSFIGNFCGTKTDGKAIGLSKCCPFFLKPFRRRTPL